MGHPADMGQPTPPELGEGLAAGGEGGLHGEGGGVGGLELEGGGDVGGGGGELIGLEIDAREDEVGGDVGGELEGGLGLGAGLVGRAAALAHLGDAGMGGGVVGVGGEGGVELLLGLGDEALGEVIDAELPRTAAACWAGGRAAIWMARIWSSWKAAWRKEASDQVRRMRVVGSKPPAPMMALRLAAEP